MRRQINGKRVDFEHSGATPNRELETGLFQRLDPYRPQSLLTGPVARGTVV
jgi:hypothetical protein